MSKETDIIHLTMGGGVKKVFSTCWGGFKKFWRLGKGGSKKFDGENFQLPSPPHQSIYEHSLSACRFISSAHFPTYMACKLCKTGKCAVALKLEIKVHNDVEIGLCWIWHKYKIFTQYNAIVVLSSDKSVCFWHVTNY